MSDLLVTSQYVHEGPVIWTAQPSLDFPRVVCCDGCGCVVGNQDRHDKVCPGKAKTS